MVHKRNSTRAACDTIPGMNEDTVFHMRASREDRELLAAIKAETGLRSDAEVMRQALRVFAKTLKIKPAPSRAS